MKPHLFTARSLTIVIIAILYSLAANSHASGQCMQTPSGCSPSPSDYPRDESCSSKRTEAEAYVLRQIQTGKSVNLPIKIPGKATYEELRGCFIADLLTNPALGIPRSGILIDSAIIKGPIDLRNAEIAPRVELTNCVFEEDLNMKRSHFMRGFSLKDSSFGDPSKFGNRGRLDSENVTIDFDFNLENCDFNNCWTFLNGMRIGRDLKLNGASFAGVADFTGTNIGGNFQAEPSTDRDRLTVFHNKADFETVKVGIDTSLRGTIFDGYVFFGGAGFTSLALDNSIFRDCVNFRNTTIDNFYLGRQDMRKQFQKTVTIEDLTFQYMSPEDWGQLKNFVEISSSHGADESGNALASNAQFYANLEVLFRKHGRIDEANQIYIEGKRKERDDLHVFGKHGDPWNILYIPLGYLEDWFFGYGRHLARLLPVSLAFLISGFFIFRRESGMKTIKSENAKRYNGQYRAFWYNLDLFLPFIGLGQAQIWTPKDSRWFAVWYKRIHIIVGHLLAPIGLAAWTGIIK